jgi:tetratricopeptide (TPR) repeat protein
VQGIGAQRDIAGALLNIGNLKYANGNLKEADRYYHRSLATSQLINNKQGILDAEGGLAPDLYASGEYGAAQQIYADMLKTALDANDKKNSALALSGTALVLFQLGDLNGARKYIDDALHAADAAGMKADHASWLCSLGDVQLAKDRLDLAGKTYAESLGASACFTQRKGC